MKNLNKKSEMKENSIKMCPNCHILYDGIGDFCSKKCKSAYSWKDVPVKYCKHCGKKLDFKMFGTKSEYKKAKFCDRQCHNDYIRYIFNYQYENSGWYKIDGADVHVVCENKKWLWEAFRDGVKIIGRKDKFGTLESTLNNIVEAFA